ncbi:kinase-like protein [Dacryopinax primogenitus]|uniref:non-specific serine/threonine protein kinase n=1 Tax=Dacryopinax primogenitus (strain DJM 731) TaxID=1858805 RepID=M5GFU6_DACPD|nr:kinase-like protein [Dacryopinax primogenitus]EJU06597.1 kinase-like protein [Dacryopinax primogenitus]
MTTEDLFVAIPEGSEGYEDVPADVAYDGGEIDEDNEVPQSDPVWASEEGSHDQQMWNETDEPADEDEEELSFLMRPPSEQAEILAEIEDVERTMPRLSEDYRLVDRLGEGTFSSVYKAEDIKYDEHLNSYWLGYHPRWSSAYYQTLPPQKTSRGKAYVAIKRIYVTSSPARIENELLIMEELRGCRHVAQLMTAFREEDQILAIMPFHRNQDFRSFYRVLPLPKIQSYFRCLFRALKDIHARNVIHRDVKPANFLFDPAAEVGTLCDFGLAQRTSSPKLKCLHSSPTTTHPHGRFSWQDTSGQRSDKLAKAKQQYLNAPKRIAQGPEKVGYPTQDERPSVRANRAGTRGFRAPEVLLKCPDQTLSAIDVWSAGVILLSFLTGKFPVFNSNDDVEALMEIAAIYGAESMAKCAFLHNRTFLTNVPSADHSGTSLSELVRKLNPSLFITPDVDQTLLAGALDLLPRLLHLDCTHRITSANALEHSFLADPKIPERTVVPHVIGQGVCGHAHWQDDMDESHCVRVDGKIVRLRAGEGIPIGEDPCEIHKDWWTDEGPGSDHGRYDM